MSTHKHIDLICVVAIVLSLVLAILFMNGSKLGLQTLTDEEEESGQFTASDQNADWDTSNATRIMLTGNDGTVNGSGAYFADGDVHISQAGKYVLSGELTDGSILIDADSEDKIWLMMDGVSLHCEDSAAILVEQAKKVFLTLADGTENTISSGEAYTIEASKAGVDGVIYSKDNLTINGTGALNVTANLNHAIVCNDNLVITGGNLSVSAPQDGIHANDSVRFANATLAIAAGDDGITVSNDNQTDFMYMESGTISISSCYEGLEASAVTIAGGTLDVTPTDDGINAENSIDIAGGDIRIVNETGVDADGLDSNGDITISGGKLLISVNGNGASSAIDYGSERGGVCSINGGTVIACGGRQMLEEINAESEQAFLMNTISGSAGAQLVLQDEDGNELLSETIPCAFSAVTLSTPEMALGDTCTLIVGDTNETITIDNSSVSGMGGGAMPNSDMGGAMQNGEAPEKPDGDMGGAMQNGEVPEKPDGDMGGAMQNGEVPEKPDGDMGGAMQNGEVPEKPDGDMGGAMQNGEAPEKPDGDMGDAMQNGETPEKPDGDMGGAMQNGETSQNEGSADELEQNVTYATASPATFTLIGISAVCLLVGLIVVIKVKY